MTAIASAQADGTVVIGPLPGDPGGAIVVRRFEPVQAVQAPVYRPTDRSVRIFLAERRRQNLQRFRVYVESELYPRNRTTPGPASVLIDTEDRFCAVANLMRQDGLEAELRRMSRTQNDVRLRTVTSGPLYDWMIASGFTIEELDRIQEPFMEVPITFDGEQRRLDGNERRRLKRVYRRILSELRTNEHRSLGAAAAAYSAHVTTRVPMPSPIVVASPPVVRPFVPSPLAAWARVR